MNCYFFVVLTFLLYCFSYASVMWNVYGDCENYATLKGHSGAVMELHYNTDGRYEQSAMLDT